jgi:hypothetical protein
MNALFSFDLFMVYTPEYMQVKNYEIIHPDMSYCTL